MKIEGRRAQFQKAIEAGPDAVRALVAALVAEGVPAAEIREVLDAFGAEKRAPIEALLAQQVVRTLSPSTAEQSSSGRRVVDVRADKKQPWWSGLPSVGTPVHPEPARDVEVQGERFSKDDVVTMLRGIRTAGS